MSTFTASNDTQREKVAYAATLGSVVAAFLASACCVGPFVLAVLGLGGAGLLLRFEPYRPYLLTVTLLFLAAGFYLVYGRPRARTSAESCECPAPRTNRAGKVLLWFATGLVAIFLAFPYVAPYLLF
ncbi:MAG: mercuric transporter [Candidatus Binatia bacterium]|nr:MAG: mercuric transporter [Candidatus Binatia bacterium]